MLEMSIKDGWEYIEEKITGTKFTIHYHNEKKVILVQKLSFIVMFQEIRIIDEKDHDRIKWFIKSGKARACYYYIMAISGA